MLAILQHVLMSSDPVEYILYINQQENYTSTLREICTSKPCMSTCQKLTSLHLFAFSLPSLSLSLIYLFYLQPVSKVFGIGKSGRQSDNPYFVLSVGRNKVCSRNDDF